MTRARDLMIFAMPKLDWDDDQWLGITGATDLLPVRNDAGEFEFSAERTLWQFRYCEPASEDQTPTKKDAIALHWFTEAGAASDRSELVFSPSSAATVAFLPPVLEHIGERITIVSCHDSADVGNAIPSVFAAGLGMAGGPEGRGVGRECVREFRRVLFRSIPILRSRGGGSDPHEEGRHCLALVYGGGCGE